MKHARSWKPFNRSALSNGIMDRTIFREEDEEKKTELISDI